MHPRRGIDICLARVISAGQTEIATAVSDAGGRGLEAPVDLHRMRGQWRDQAEARRNRERQRGAAQARNRVAGFCFHERSRSEERRGGKECVSTLRSWWSACH